MKIKPDSVWWCGSEVPKDLFFYSPQPSCHLHSFVTLSFLSSVLASSDLLQVLQKPAWSILSSLLPPFPGTQSLSTDPEHPPLLPHPQTFFKCPSQPFLLPHLHSFMSFTSSVGTCTLFHHTGLECQRQPKSGTTIQQRQNQTLITLNILNIVTPDALIPEEKPKHNRQRKYATSRSQKLYFNRTLEMEFSWSTR